VASFCMLGIKFVLKSLTLTSRFIKASWPTERFPLHRYLIRSLLRGGFLKENQSPIAFKINNPQDRSKTVISAQANYDFRQNARLIIINDMIDNYQLLGDLIGYLYRQYSRLYPRWRNNQLSNTLKIFLAINTRPQIDRSLRL